jgi:hypothetical protein
MKRDQYHRSKQNARRDGFARFPIVPQSQSAMGPHLFRFHLEIREHHRLMNRRRNRRTEKRTPLLTKTPIAANLFFAL